MASPIRRLVQLIFDKLSGKRTEDDAKKAIGGIEGALGGLRRAALKLGAALAAAFGLRALVRWGQEAVRQATEAEMAWTDLAGSIDNAGESFNDLEGDLRALSNAFQDATTHTDEDYATSLSRLISLSGDVQASLANMGLVANVAAKFFKGELAPAVDLVAKVMNGQTMILQRMGIHVKNAQEGLEVLAQRSFGEAERRAGTFGGQLIQLNNLWDEFKEQTGAAIVSSGDAAGAIDVLKAAVRALTDAVVENRTELQTGFASGMKSAIVVIDGVYRGVRGLAEILSGALVGAIGLLSSPLALMLRGFELWAGMTAKLADMLGADGLSGKLDGFRERVEQFRQDVSRPLTVAGELFREGLGRFTERTQLAEDMLAGVGSGVRAPRRTFGVDTPRVGKNAKPEKPTGEPKKDPRAEALKKFEEDMRAASALSELLGKDFDFLGAKASALQTVIASLGAAGVAPTSKEMMDFGAELRATRLDVLLGEFHTGMREIAVTADLLGPRFDAVGAEADLLRATIQKLTLQGIDPQSEALANLKQRLAEVEPGIRNVVREIERAEQMRAAMDTLTGATPSLEGLQAEAGALESAMSQIIAKQMELTGAVDLTDPSLVALADRFRDVKTAIEETTEAMQFAESISGAVGEAINAAFSGNLGKVAAGKVKQNIIEALELRVRAFVAALNPFTAGTVPGLLAGAQMHLGLAAAWAGLAAVGGAAGALGGGGGGGGGGSVGGARGLSAGASKGAEPMNEVHVHFVGPSVFDPKVQKALTYAVSKEQERRSKNSKITVHRGASR